MALAMPALADVDVFARIDKYKYVCVDETILIDKDVDIDVDVVPTNVTDMAEALALANQVIESNDVTFSNDGGNIDTDDLPWLQAEIDASVIGNIGITGVNQDVGNHNNQGTNMAIAISLAGDGDTFANSESSAEQRNEFNNVFNAENPDSLDPLAPQKRSDLTGSVLTNSGITTVNQTAGNMNNQLTNLALAIGFGSVVVALAEADLGQYNADNYVFEENTHKLDNIDGSIVGNVGITAVNQSTGSMNNQANVISIATVGTP
jgi:hypothetical protein